MKTPYDVPSLPGAYLIIDDDNEKAYIGSTTDLRRRMQRHSRDLKNNVHDNPELQELHNRKEVNFIPLVTDDKEQALDFEQSVLNAFHNTEVLCNIASDAREAGKNFQLSPSHRVKLIQSNIGRPKSEEHRKAISQTLTGRKLDPDRAEKARTAALGSVRSEEHKRKISEANKGKTVSEETRKKQSEAKHFPLSINDKIYHNGQEAANDLKLTRTTISRKVKSDKYPNWKKLNDNEI